MQAGPRHCRDSRSSRCGSCISPNIPQLAEKEYEHELHNVGQLSPWNTMVTFLLHLNRLLPACQISYKSKSQASLGLRRLQFVSFCRGTNASETARCQIQTRIGLLFGSVRMKQKRALQGMFPLIHSRPLTIAVQSYRCVHSALIM